jgi:hypothetical protein
MLYLYMELTEDFGYAVRLCYAGLRWFVTIADRDP